MSDYSAVAGGSLKLKGGGITKKKKKTKKTIPPVDREDSNEQRSREESVVSGSEAGSRSAPKRTEAELKFEEIQRRRLDKKLGEKARQTHAERVADLNAKLDRLSEHNDMPKIGPG
ncbi:hypothetical protein YB2330_002703 [Saitoella coloradoensis]